MTKQWRQTIFDEVVRLKRGYDLPNQDIIDGTYPVVASSNIKARHNQFKVKPPGVVTGRSGTLGIVQFVNEKFWPLNTALYAKDFRGNYPKFVYYFLTVMKLENFNAGAGVPTLNQNHLHKIPVMLPPLEEQNKIAAILSSYDDLIENNQRRITLLEKMAEEIYREWFARFRFPGYQSAEFEKGIPKGWETDYAHKFFGHVKGKSYSGNEIFDDMQEKSMPFINLKSFNRGGGYRENGLKYYTGTYRKEQVVQEGDVVMAVTDMTQNREVVGRVARVPDVGSNGAVVSLDVIKLTPKTISSTFLYSYLKYSGFGDFIKGFANGANVLHLNADLVTQQKIVIPPENLRTQFDNLVSPIHEQIGSLSKSIQVLEQTRSQLLPRLISGKLSVENLDIQFPPSMLEETVSNIEEKQCH